MAAVEQLRSKCHTKQITKEAKNLKHVFKNCL